MFVLHKQDPCANWRENTPELSTRCKFGLGHVDFGVQAAQHDSFFLLQTLPCCPQFRSIQTKNCPWSSWKKLMLKTCWWWWVDCADNCDYLAPGVPTQATGFVEKLRAIPVFVTPHGSRNTKTKICVVFCLNSNLFRPNLMSTRSLFRSSRDAVFFCSFAISETIPPEFKKKTLILGVRIT